MTAASYIFISAFRVAASLRNPDIESSRKKSGHKQPAPVPAASFGIFNMDTTEFQGNADSGRHEAYYRSPREERPMALGPVHDVSAQKLARGLAWFSIGLGTAELLAPRAVAALCGRCAPGRALASLAGTVNCVAS